MFSWVKALFVDDVSEEQIKEMMQEQEPQMQTPMIDYKLKIFDVRNRDELSQVTSFIVQDKSMALIKMNKFTGDYAVLKETLNELKQTCDNCNSKILGVSNNMFIVTKNSIEVLKE
ncbi:MAG: hypothetical protein AABW45_01835 [Nanoarchaeota archaeon]